MKRFYKTVHIDRSNGGFAVLLDGKVVRTPLGNSLVLPSRALADAVGEEWCAQEKEISPESMPLTRLANATVDWNERDRHPIVVELLNYADSDLLCYRAGDDELARWQRDGWDAILDWLARRHGAHLSVTVGMMHVPQPQPSLAVLEGLLGEFDAGALIALRAASAITGSLVLSLALLDGHLDAQTAHRLSRLDESYQAKKWGEDAEAAMRTRSLASELESIERFMRLART
ncbi:MAG: ATPase [Alphaproteobacteria bacterium]|nr:ATPase [Alphaproteobacteria bacterium]